MLASSVIVSSTACWLRRKVERARAAGQPRPHRWCGGITPLNCTAAGWCLPSCLLTARECRCGRSGGALRPAGGRTRSAPKVVVVCRGNRVRPSPRRTSSSPGASRVAVGQDRERDRGRDRDRGNRGRDRRDRDRGRDRDRVHGLPLEATAAGADRPTERPWWASAGKVSRAPTASGTGGASPLSGGGAAVPMFDHPSPRSSASASS